MNNPIAESQPSAFDSLRSVVATGNNSPDGQEGENPLIDYPSVDLGEVLEQVERNKISRNVNYQQLNTRPSFRKGANFKTLWGNFNPGRPLTKVGYGINSELPVGNVFQEMEINEPIPLTLNKPSGWVMEEGVLYVKAWCNDQVSTIYDEEIVVWAIYELMLGINFELKEDINCSELPTWRRNTSINISSILNVTLLDTEMFTFPSNLSVEAGLNNATLLFLLLMSMRFHKTPTEVSAYATRLFNHVRLTLVNEPFHCSNVVLDEIMGFKNQIVMLRKNLSILKLAAAFDYLLKINPRSLFSSIRMATLSVHNHDHALLNTFNSIGVTMGQSQYPFLYFVVFEDAMREYEVFGPHYALIFNYYSLNPYSRSLNLITKSVFSANANPHLYTMLNTYLALAAGSSFFNVRKPNMMVDADIVVGYYMHIFYATEKVAAVRFTSDEQYSFPMECRGDTGISATIKLINILRACKNRLTLPILQDMAKFLPESRRSGTLGDHIATLLGSSSEHYLKLQPIPELPVAHRTVDSERFVPHPPSDEIEREYTNAFGKLM